MCYCYRHMMRGEGLKVMGTVAGDEISGVTETGKSVKTHVCAPTSSGISRLRVCTESSKEKNQH